MQYLLGVISGLVLYPLLGLLWTIGQDIKDAKGPRLNILSRERRQMMLREP